MSRLRIEAPSESSIAYNQIASQASERLMSIPNEQCPIDYIASLTRMFLANSCGKCTPCRVGLSACLELFETILEGDGTKEDAEAIRLTSQTMFESADCAIGFTAGRILLEALEGFKEDLFSHINHDKCLHQTAHKAPCIQECPAHVDIPSYIACVREGRLDDALRIIRNANPLPTVCGYVCEHPCEMVCRRSIEDAAVNICGLKRYAADNAQWSCAPRPLHNTGKRIAVIGGGPAGLTAAYYLQLMGHEVVIFDQREKLGGMVRYGIPDYRLPQEKLDADIEFILSTGVRVQTNCAVGTDIPIDNLMNDFDAIYISIGAHEGKKLGCEGEDAKGVYSAVEFLRAVAQHNLPDFTGKRVVVIGGGNVAMDCTRTAKRLGSASVECVYRRRIADMTALAEEIDEAKAEGCQITQLEAPIKIEVDGCGNVCGLVTQPQVIGAVGRGGRPTPYDADRDPNTIDCDIVIMAIGQAIDSSAFSEIVQTEWGCIVAQEDGSIQNAQVPLYAGGDAVSGPLTVIKAIAAGKVAAANIDEALGFSHNVHDPVNTPFAKASIGRCGRIELKDGAYAEATQSFDIAKLGMTAEEALQESSRCLRCDHYGRGKTCEEIASW